MEIPQFEPFHWGAVIAALILGVVAVTIFWRSRLIPTILTLTEKQSSQAGEIERLYGEISAAKQDIVNANQSAKEWEVHSAQLKTLLDEELRRSEEKAQLLATAEERLTSTFKALSADSLQASQSVFLDLAKASFEKLQQSAQGDLELRKQAIEGLVKPVAEQLKSVDEKVQLLENARIAAYTELVEQCKVIGRSHDALSLETRSLVSALRQPKVRGQWGEMQLRRVAEFAGMLEHCDFLTEVNLTTEDGKLRPDMIINLPGNRCVVVDAKTPLDAYLDAAQASDDTTRNQALERHARQVRTHMRQLGSKKYFTQVETSPEFVVLFLPGEMYFSAALEVDPSLLEADKYVILATPTTLIALLRSVSYSWRQEAIARNAIEISILGQSLYKNLCTLGEHLGRVGSGLNTSVSNYNKLVASLESRVFTSARKFTLLGAASDKDAIEEVSPIEAVARMIQRPELDNPESHVADNEDETIAAQRWAS